MFLTGFSPMLLPIRRYVDHVFVLSEDSLLPARFRALATALGKHIKDSSSARSESV